MPFLHFLLPAVCPESLCIIGFYLDTLFTGGIEHETEIFHLPALRQYRGDDSG
jgi:hypothetical protein